MKLFNLGLPEILFILIIAVILFGPNNLIKSAREIGALLRKATQSPYWKEVWATKRDLDEIPKMLAKEANLDETLNELNLESQKISGSFKTAVTDIMKESEEINKPEKNID